MHSPSFCILNETYKTDKSSSQPNYAHWYYQWWSCATLEVALSSATEEACDPAPAPPAEPSSYHPRQTTLTPGLNLTIAPGVAASITLKTSSFAGAGAPPSLSIKDLSSISHMSLRFK